jgi:hypothetical protein
VRAATRPVVVGGRRRRGLGTPEIIALAAAALLLLTTLFSYFYLLRPERVRLARLTGERQQLESELQAASIGVKRSADTQASVQEILDSLQNFEATHLGTTDDRLRLVDELNAKILRNKLRISGGMSYSQLEETAPDVTRREQPRQQRPPGATGSAKAVQSVFPGIAVTATVEGTYANLRRFIRDVEATGRHFVVIDAVELEGVTDTASQPPAVAAVAPEEGEGESAAPATAPPQTVSRGALVSLRLNLAAYFRRVNAYAAQPEEQQPEAARP